MINEVKLLLVGYRFNEGQDIQGLFIILGFIYIFYYINSRLYIYGGIELNVTILKDFYSIDLSP